MSLCWAGCFGGTEGGPCAAPAPAPCPLPRQPPLRHADTPALAPPLCSYPEAALPTEAAAACLECWWFAFLGPALPHFTAALVRLSA